MVDSANAETRTSLPGSINLKPTFNGATLLLRPMRADDFEQLYAVAADPLIWEQHPEPSRCQRDVFRRFFDTGLAEDASLVVIDKANGKMIGSSRYYDYNEAVREIAIGYTFLARSHWGGATNGELKTLMLQHIFAWADVVWFHIGASNWRSRKALEKIGGVLSHEAMRDVNGQPTPYAYYRIFASTWLLR